jgi:hypothetical protein
MTYINIVMGRTRGSTIGLPCTQDIRGVPKYKPGKFVSDGPERTAGRGWG